MIRLHSERKNIINMLPANVGLRISAVEVGPTCTIIEYKYQSLELLVEAHITCYHDDIDDQPLHGIEYLPFDSPLLDFMWLSFTTRDTTHVWQKGYSGGDERSY